MESKTATTANRVVPEVRRSGRSVAPGLGMGEAWVVVDVLKSSVVPAAIGKEEIDRELHRLKQAVEEALEEIDRYARRIESEFDSALAGVFRAWRHAAEPVCLG